MARTKLGRQADFSKEFYAIRTLKACGRTFAPGDLYPWQELTGLTKRRVISLFEARQIGHADEVASAREAKDWMIEQRQANEAMQRELLNASLTNEAPLEIPIVTPIEIPIEPEPETVEQPIELESVITDPDPFGLDEPVVAPEPEVTPDSPILQPEPAIEPVVDAPIVEPEPITDPEPEAMPELPNWLKGKA